MPSGGTLNDAARHQASQPRPALLLPDPESAWPRQSSSSCNLERCPAGMPLRSRSGPPMHTRPISKASALSASGCNRATLASLWPSGCCWHWPAALQPSRPWRLSASLRCGGRAGGLRVLPTTGRCAPQSRGAPPGAPLASNLCPQPLRVAGRPSGLASPAGGFWAGGSSPKADLAASAASDPPCASSVLSDRGPRPEQTMSSPVAERTHALATAPLRSTTPQALEARPSGPAHSQSALHR